MSWFPVKQRPAVAAGRCCGCGRLGQGGGVPVSRWNTSAYRARVAVTMAGGYAYDVHDTVDVYFQTVRLAVAWSKRWGE